jgi:hypothetical protein
MVGEMIQSILKKAREEIALRKETRDIVSSVFCSTGSEARTVQYVAEYSGKKFGIFGNRYTLVRVTPIPGVRSKDFRVDLAGDLGARRAVLKIFEWQQNALQMGFVQKGLPDSDAYSVDCAAKDFGIGNPYAVIEMPHAPLPQDNRPNGDAFRHHT